MFGRIRAMMKQNQKPGRHANARDPGGSPPRLCTLLLNQAEAPATATLRDALKQRLDAGLRLDDHDQQPGNWLLELSSGQQALITHLPQPVPETEVVAAAQGQYLWPEGPDEVVAHQAQLTITLVEPPPDRVEAAMLLTRLAHVFLRAADGLALYWGGGTVCSSADLVDLLTVDMDREHLPLPLWIRFQPVRNEDERIGLFTAGLPAFDLMNIEIETSPWDPVKLIEFAFNVSHYLLNEGPVLREGETVGKDDEQTVTVQVMHSLLERPGQVYRLIVCPC